MFGNDDQPVNFGSYRLDYISYVQHYHMGALRLQQIEQRIDRHI